MRGAVLYGPRDVRFEERDVPRIISRPMPSYGFPTAWKSLLSRHVSGKFDVNFLQPRRFRHAVRKPAVQFSQFYLPVAEPRAGEGA